MARTLEEQEFSIYGNAAERNVIYGFADDPYWQRRFEAAGAELVRTDGDARFYKLRLNQITIRKPSKKRDISPERKAELSTRMRALRASQVTYLDPTPKTGIVETDGAQ